MGVLSILLDSAIPATTASQPQPQRSHILQALTLGRQSSSGGRAAALAAYSVQRVCLLPLSSNSSGPLRGKVSEVGPGGH